MQSTVPPPRRAYAFWMWWVTASLVSSLIISLGIRALVRRYPAEFESGTMFSVIIMPCFLMVALHELGHLAAGLAAHLRPVLFVVGPLRVERTGSGFRAALRWGEMWEDGLARWIPPSGRGVARRMATMVAGGPLASLAGVVLSIGIHVAFPDMSGGAHLSVLVGGVASAALFTSAIIPSVSTRGRDSDGARLLRYARGGAEVRAEIAVLSLVAESMAGARPREWSPELLADLERVAPDSPYAVDAGNLASAAALDHGDVAAARVHLERALAAGEDRPGGLREGHLLNAAYFFARYAGDAPRARALFERAAAGGLIPDAAPPFVEAAIAWAEGDIALARQRLAVAEALRVESADRGGERVIADEYAGLRALVDA